MQKRDTTYIDHPKYCSSSLNKQVSLLVFFIHALFSYFVRIIPLKTLPHLLGFTIWEYSQRVNNPLKPEVCITIYSAVDKHDLLLTHRLMLLHKETYIQKLFEPRANFFNNVITPYAYESQLYSVSLVNLSTPLYM